MPNLKIWGGNISPPPNLPRNLNPPNNVLPPVLYWVKNRDSRKVTLLERGFTFLPLRRLSYCLQGKGGYFVWSPKNANIAGGGEMIWERSLYLGIVLYLGEGFTLGHKKPSNKYSILNKINPPPSLGVNCQAEQRRK